MQPAMVARVAKGFEEEDGRCKFAEDKGKGERGPSNFSFFNF